MRILLLTLLAVAAAICGNIAPVAAAEPEPRAPVDKAAWSKQLAPFLDDTTFAVVRFDVPNPDLQTILKVLQAQQVELTYVKPDSLRDVFLRLGAAKNVSEVAALFHFVTMQDDGGEPFDLMFITPLVHTSGEIDDLALFEIVAEGTGSQLTPEEKRQAMIRHGDWVAITPLPQNAERLRNLTPRDPVELETAARAIPSAPIEVIVMLNDKRLELLDETGLIPGMKWTNPFFKKLNFVSLSGAYLNGGRLDAVVETRTNEDAQEFRDLVDRLTKPETAPPQIPPPLLPLGAHYLVPKVNENRLSVSLTPQDIGVIRETVEPAIVAARAAADKARAKDNLRQIALGIYNFVDTFRYFPPAKFPKDANGKPLLSWRVYLLPQLEQVALFDQFHLDEPWDSPHNIKLAAKLPACYIDPNHPLDDPSKTTFVMPVGEKAISTGDGKLLSFREILDGTRNTIMVMNVSPDEAVIWTKPDDWQYDPERPFHGLDKINPEGEFNVVMADGHVRTFSTKTLKPETMRNLIERADGNVIPEEVFE